MSTIVTELLIIFVLLVANGLFAMSEIAVVSSRKSRLRDLAEKGDTRAQVALELAESPSLFLPTVQIGITLVGVLAGAFGGATIASEIATALRPFPYIGEHGQLIGLSLVVLTITYLSLVIGELVPKHIGLGNPEGVALRVAKPLKKLSRIAGPLVHGLSGSTELLLRTLGMKTTPKMITEDEVKGLMQEGLRAGAFQKVESEMVENVLQLDQLPVRNIMTPRPKIIWLRKDDSHEEVWHK
ncbi:HlyC/CorC family transporter, partial [bacterium]|nr:HlyC/CorC family transporter [bacterium]